MYGVLNSGRLSWETCVYGFKHIILHSGEKTKIYIESFVISLTGGPVLVQQPKIRPLHIHILVSEKFG